MSLGDIAVLLVSIVVIVMAFGLSGSGGNINPPPTFNPPPPPPAPPRVNRHYRPGMLIELRHGETLAMLNTVPRATHCASCGAPDEGLSACSYCGAKQ